MNELADLADWVRKQAVPRLVTGIDPPQPVLPARYDIRVGHDDERRAVSAGSARSAAELHGERLSAASVRRDMVETLGMLDNAPSPGQLQAWLESLTDQEMLSRFAQFRPTTTYDPDILMQNYELFSSMCDDARRFAGLDVD